MGNQIIFYEKANGESPVCEFLCELPLKLRAKTYWEIELLKEHGIVLKEPYVKVIKGEKYKGLWELRIKQGSDISRILYFMPIGKTFVLLHGFLKKTQKTPEIELEMALSRKIDYERRF